MLFSSMVFLWVFLPATLVLYNIFRSTKAKNMVLLLASLIFYAWGEPIYVILLLASVTINFFMGIWIDKAKNPKLPLVLDIIINIGVLFFYKYSAAFCTYTNLALGKTLLTVREIALPLGISFFTFQILSYEIDLYRKTISVQKNYLDFALYVMLFPQLVAGPIVKYKDVELQLKDRTVSSQKFVYGIRRFIYGLGKKVIISNSLAAVVSNIQAQNPGEVGSQFLWMSTLFYTLHIYYDFSGYSDMAIGLGKMFGFDFAENFDYPYISRSITEFWKRWHISLTTWFREYVYFPLGGNRKGKVRTYVNISIIFLLTGLWHGSTLNFLLWGIFHGVFMVIERLGFKKVLDKSHVLSRIYTLFIVNLGWAIFSVNNLTEAINLVKGMFAFNFATTFTWREFATNQSMAVLVLAIFLAGPFQAIFKKAKEHIFDEEKTNIIEMVFQVVIVLLCFVYLASDAYNPFVYFRF